MAKRNNHLSSVLANCVLSIAKLNLLPPPMSDDSSGKDT